MTQIRIMETLDQLPREQWNACFPGALENYDYLRSVEASGIPGFSWAYAVALEGNELRAAMPGFLTEYQLDTTFEGTAKRFSSALRSMLPGMLTLKLACLGSPVTEHGLIGFHPSLAVEQHAPLLRDMLQAFEDHAAAKGARIVGLKDIPHQDEMVWTRALRGTGYRAVPGLPTATLSTDFPDMDSYFAQLSSGTRKDMRRKLRARDGLRIEHRENIDDVLPRIMELYHDTRRRAEMQFEELTPAFFSNVLSNMPGHAFCTLYYAGENLLAANLLLRDDTMLLDKFFVMDSERGREHNLYFISWFTNISYCISHGLKQYQSGQAAYENKLRLGSTLTRTSMFFKHRNRFIHGALRLAVPLLVGNPAKEAA